MKKLLWLLPVVLFFWLAPLPVKGQAGTYNTTSRLFYCENRAICLHEMAHALDQRAGWVSQSPAFYKAVQLYLFVELRKPVLQQMPADILELTLRPNDSNRPIKMELYAYLFQWAQGKPEGMPEGLRPFYDWEAAQDWLAHLNDQQHVYLFP